MNKQPRMIDLTGKKYGMLTVIKREVKTRAGNSRWLCKCECGNEGTFVGNNLKNGNTRSCGCFRRNIKMKHGLNGTRLAHCYDSMKTRCYNRNYYRYDRYGGRGIKVCKEWIDNIETFFKWSLENGYRDDLTLDRIDNNGNYEPNNCRWATKKEQGRNMGVTIFVEIDGVSKALQDWCEIFNIKVDTAHTRRRYGKSGMDLFKPVRGGKKHVG